MHNRKSIIQFSVVVVVLSVLLFYPWVPAIQRGYLSAFRACNDTLFSRYWFWGDGYVHFLDLSSKTLHADVEDITSIKLPPRLKMPELSGQQDTLMVIRNRKMGSFGMLRISGRIIGYWPTVWLLVLILAKPMTWKRRGWACLWGMGLVHVFIALRITIKLADDAFGAPGKVYALFQPSPFVADVLSRLEQILTQDPTISFVVPTFIWFLVAFTWKDLSILRQVVRGGDTPDAPTVE